MATERLKNALAKALLGVALVLGIAALALLGWTSRQPEAFGRLHDLLLAINAAGVFILSVLIVANLARLFRELLRRRPGAKLKARMLAAIVGLVVAPLVVVYLFAVQFLNRGIDTWFDVEVQAGLGDALTLSRAALDRRMHESMQNTRRIAGRLLRVDADNLAGMLDELRREAGATEVTLYARNYLVIATSHEELAAPFPVPPSEDVILQLRQSGGYLGVDPLGNGHYQVRAAISLPNARLGQESYVLQAVYPVVERIGTLVDSVEKTYSQYSELVFLREPLKTSFALTLTLVVLLSVLIAVSGAFFFARRLVAPILSVVAGTRAVAAGDFDTRLPVASSDEIGFLIDSFNQMIRRLSRAREVAILSERRLEKERAHVEAILARLSTGVLVVEPDGRIRHANDAASTMLDVNLAGSIGRRLDDLLGEHETLAGFMSGIAPYLESGATEWREQIGLQGATGRRVLVCASSVLTGAAGKPDVNVIVFDDVTKLLQAQRDAAWGEIARRMAHEIKNPLTPIQLSAERIRRRYLDGMKEMEAEVLDRATNTIIAQVEAMRDMVNAFSDYARAPEINITRLDLNRLIREVVYLYRTHDSHARLGLELDPAVGEIDADSARLRQLLHNLIRNALEAMEGQANARIEIATRIETVAGCEFAAIRIADCGPGIAPETLDRLFDPYVTTKNKGTGLGLAIVRKLVEEHGGTVIAENRVSGGALLTVRLPVRHDPQARERRLAPREIAS